MTTNYTDHANPVWLIERNTNGFPEWYAGSPVTDIESILGRTQGKPVWSKDPLKAERYTREVIAEVFIKLLGIESTATATEHLFE